MNSRRGFYDEGIVRSFVLATVIWSVVALLLGVTIALQLANYRMNLGLPWTTFGRLRPLHTNAAIFAFGGNAVFAGIYYSMQRLLKTRMFSDFLSRVHFWGWQLIIVSAALTLPFGITVGKEYAELEWPIDLAIAVVWVIFAVNFFGTLWRRRERHIYVAIWFYMATVLTIAVLHITNSLAIPVTLFKSYPVFAGFQDAMVQWWYGHNAVAFFLTTPFLGLMYYFMPKVAEGPVYSYRLSIIHFWSLVFMYIWAGPHHLLYTALPEWAQTLGMIFSVALVAPSWGGMINGLLTLRGAWDRLRTEPILKFMVAALTFYGMSTFEGPLLSIKSVSALAHYTDWIVGHAHGGALGWNGFLSFGMIYWLVPRLWRSKLHSTRLANFHFWTGFTGIILYMASMWAAGITQGLMLRGVDASGKLLYPDFVETVMKIVPLYWVRAFGGLLYLVGVLAGVYNLARTIGAGKKQIEDERISGGTDLKPWSIPQFLSSGGTFHHRLEGVPMVFAVLALLAVLTGSALEMLPAFLAQEAVEVNPVLLSGKRAATPYTPLELQGRDLYVREGCYVCHSQMIRPLAAEYLRYGPPSTLAESIYDRPFQWGSKRTGPDLARVGKKYPALWHYRHMADPREVVSGSLMPAYPWLFKDRTDFGVLGRKLAVQKQLGVPYTQEQVDHAEAYARGQAGEIAAELEKEGVQKGVADREIVALIAYLMRLGR